MTEPSRAIFLGILPPLAAFAVQWLAWPLLQPRAWSLFYVAVVLSGWFGGLRSGLVATGLSVLLGWYFFLTSARSFAIQSFSDAASIVIFLGIGGLFGVLPGRLRKAERQSHEALAQLSAVNEQLEMRVGQRAAELLHSNESREASEARLSGVVGSAMDAIVSVDESQRVVQFNAAAEKMFGCPAAEALGQTLDRFIPARFRERHHRHIDDFEKTGVTTRSMGALRPISGLRANGEEFPIEASISQVEVGGQKIFTAIVRDISERARAEAAAALRARQQEAVSDLSRHALAGRDLDRLGNDAATLLAQLLELECAEVLELNRAGDELLLRAGVGWREGCIGSQTVRAAHESQAGFTLISDEPVIVEDLAGETRFHPPPLLLEHGAVSGMTCVIRGKLQPYGVLGAHSTSRRSFSRDDIHFLQSIADVLAAAIERRELEEELLAISGREQKRVGQDLHDGLCQHLVGIEFRTEALARDLEGSPAAREAERIGALIRDATRQARMLARGLAPVELEKNGLMSALTELAANSAHLYRIECRFICEQPVLIADGKMAAHLYRIVQEGISNAVRHARAKQIEISLRVEKDEAELTVTNDGAPLPETPGRTGGMGLGIMRYRAELIGATLRLRSTAEGKTALNCVFNPGA